jgi:nucleotide-binding universal stress UspA family protein
MNRRILVPIDGTQASDFVVDAAVGFARETGAQLIGLHVIALRPLLGEGMGVSLRQESAEQVKECFAYLERRATDAGVVVEVVTRRADAPCEAILAAARELQCDLIVMGTHRRSGVRAALPGSQTTAVLTHSRIPVLVIPQPGIRET